MMSSWIAENPHECVLVSLSNFLITIVHYQKSQALEEVNLNSTLLHINIDEGCTSLGMLFLLGLHERLEMPLEVLRLDIPSRQKDVREILCIGSSESTKSLVFILTSDGLELV